MFAAVMAYIVRERKAKSYSHAIASEPRTEELQKRVSELEKEVEELRSEFATQRSQREGNNGKVN